MDTKFLMPVFLGVILLLQPMSMGSFAQAETIPDWVKKNADWWSQGLISDKDFAAGLGFMVKERIIHVDNVELDPNGEISISENLQLPGWIKNNARWWVDGGIGDNDFKSGIQHMFQEEIISFKEKPRSNDSSIIIPLTEQRLKDLYVSVQWQQLAVKRLLDAKNIEAKMYDDASKTAWNELAKNHDPILQDEAIALESAFKNVNDDASSLVKISNQLKTYEEALEEIASLKNVPKIYIEEAAKEPIEEMDETAEDADDAYDDAKDANENAEDSFESVMEEIGGMKGYVEIMQESVKTNDDPVDFGFAFDLDDSFASEGPSTSFRFEMDDEDLSNNFMGELEYHMLQQLRIFDNDSIEVSPVVDEDEFIIIDDLFESNTIPTPNADDASSSSSLFNEDDDICIMELDLDYAILIQLDSKSGDVIGTFELPNQDGIPHDLLEEYGISSFPSDGQTTGEESENILIVDPTHLGNTIDDGEITQEEWDYLSGLPGFEEDATEDLCQACGSCWGAIHEDICAFCYQQRDGSLADDPCDQCGATYGQEEGEECISCHQEIGQTNDEESVENPCETCGNETNEDDTSCEHCGDESEETVTNPDELYAWIIDARIINGKAYPAHQFILSSSNSGCSESYLKPAADKYNTSYHVDFDHVGLTWNGAGCGSFGTASSTSYVSEYPITDSQATEWEQRFGITLKEFPYSGDGSSSSAQEETESNSEPSCNTGFIWNESKQKCVAGFSIG